MNRSEEWLIERFGKATNGISLAILPERAKSQKNPPTEHAEQAAFFDWVRPYLKTRGIAPSLCYAVPNGAYLGADPKMRAIIMRKLKAAGLTVGVCDINLDWPKPGLCSDHGCGNWIFAGLRIEMKRKPNKPDADQQAHISALRQAGYNVVVAYGFEEARRTVEAYLG